MPNTGFQSCPPFMPHGMDWRAYLLAGRRATMSKRECSVIVFIDAQNVHRDLRRAFVPDHESAALDVGNFHPMLFAERLVAMGPEFEHWQLKEVRAYMGQPLHDRQPTAAAAMDRQLAAWKTWGVTSRPRPLYYPPDWPTQSVRQKGVDVELAVDVVRMAMQIEFQIGIIASTDKDLRPAIEAIHRLRGQEATPRICTIRYGALQKRLSYTDKSGRSVHSFHFTEEDYLAVRDPTEYRIEVLPDQPE